MSTHSSSQVTQLERYMNIIVVSLFAMLFVLASLMAAGNQIWTNAQPGRWYLEMENKWPYPQVWMCEHAMCARSHLGPVTLVHS